MRRVKNVMIAAAWAMVSTHLVAQTQVDLRTQSKAVDFRAAQSTRPIKSGSILPATCEVAELFFLTSAAAGSNLYACPSTNSWVVESGSGGVAGIDGACQFNDNGALGGDSGCTYNKTTQVLTATGGVHAGSGTRSSGLVLPELSVNGSNYFAIYGADEQMVDACIILNGAPTANGDVLTYTGTSASTTETLPKMCALMEWRHTRGQVGDAVLDFPSMSAGQCASLTFGLTGVAEGDHIAPGYPATLDTGVIGQMWISAVDVVSVQLCNLSGATLDPASATYSAQVF